MVEGKEMRISQKLIWVVVIFATTEAGWAVLGWAILIPVSLAGLAPLWLITAEAAEERWLRKDAQRARDRAH